MEHEPHTTRYPSPITQNVKESDEKKISEIAHHFEGIMKALGLDLEDPSLEKTPERVAKMYVQEIFSGLKEETFPPISFIEHQYGGEGRSQMLFMKVHFTSFCEHHFVPMMGFAYIAYIPNKKLIGLSKIPRIVRHFARRPQVQERLTAQISDCLQSLLETEHVAVAMSAQHFCVLARGIEDQHGYTTTHLFKGDFDRDPHLRQEFFTAQQRESDIF